MYREFTDATFTHRVDRPEWMGFLGPILSGEQGDVIRIVFKNMAFGLARNFSMHPHGTQYTKENEGETNLLLFFFVSITLSAIFLTVSLKTFFLYHFSLFLIIGIELKFEF